MTPASAGFRSQFLRHIAALADRLVRSIFGRHRAPPTGGRQPLSVFISYARKDNAFVERLVDALKLRGVQVWLDRREIAPSADWLQRIVQGIVDSRFFAFVVSPDSVASEMCAVELRQAVSLNKPMVPVRWRQAETLPTEIAALQWSDFAEPAPFEAALETLVSALRRDPEWLAAHARYATAAGAWSAGGKRWFLLLHGGAIAEARRWLGERDGALRRPTGLQEEFIAASRRFSRRWRTSLVVGLLFLVPATGIALYFNQLSDRETAARELASRAVQLRNDDQSALPRSTVMLAEAVSELSLLGARAPEIDAELRRSMHLLLRPRGEGVHPNGVDGVAIDPLRKTVATFAMNYSADVSAAWEGKSDSTVRLWSAPSPSPFATLPHDAPVSAAAFDGSNRLVTGTIHGEIRFWNLAAVRAGAKTAEHAFKPQRPDDLAEGIASIAASPGEALAVTAAGTGRVCGWNTESGEQRWCAEHADGEGVIHLAISPDGQLVAAGGPRGLIELRRAHDGLVLQRMKHRSGGAITAVIFSPGSNQLASGDEKGEMHFWNAENGHDDDVVAHRDAVTEIAYAAADAPHPIVATASTDGSLRLLDRSLFSSVRIEEFPTDYALWHIAIDPTGRLVAVARGDGFVDFWGRAERRVVGRVHVPSGDIATGMAFLAGDLVVIVDGGQGVRFFEPTAGRDAWLADTGRQISTLAISATGMLAAADFAGEGAFWQLSERGPARSPLGALAFTSNGGALATVDDRANLLSVLRMPEGTETAHWAVPENIGAVAWHPARPAIAVAKRDGGIWVRDAVTGNELRHAELGGIDLSFAVEGAWLAIVDPDKGLHIWDVDGAAAPVALVDGATVTQAVFLRTARRLVTADKDGRVRLWQTPSPSAGAGSLRPAWSVDSCPQINALATSDDDRLIAVGCEDGRIMTWLVATGQAAAQLAYPGKVGALAFAPGGHTLIAGGSAGLQGLLVERQDLVAETCARLVRNLSLAEWSRDVGSRHCRLTCPALPGCD